MRISLFWRCAYIRMKRHCRKYFVDCLEMKKRKIDCYLKCSSILLFVFFWSNTYWIRGLFHLFISEVQDLHLFERKIFDLVQFPELHTHPNLVVYTGKAISMYFLYDCHFLRAKTLRQLLKYTHKQYKVNHSFKFARKLTRNPNRTIPNVRQFLCRINIFVRLPYIMSRINCQSIATTYNHTFKVETRKGTRCSFHIHDWEIQIFYSNELLWCAIIW